MLLKVDRVTVTCPHAGLGWPPPKEQPGTLLPVPPGGASGPAYTILASCNVQLQLNYICFLSMPPEFGVGLLHEAAEAAQDAPCTILGGRISSALCTTAILCPIRQSNQKRSDFVCVLGIFIISCVFLVFSSMKIGKTDYYSSSNFPVYFS